MSQIGSSPGSDRVKSWVEQGRIMSQTGSNHGSSRVNSWVEPGRIMGQTGSDGVESWVERGRILSPIGSNHGWKSEYTEFLSDFFCSKNCKTHASSKVVQHLCVFNVQLARPKHFLIVYRIDTRRPTNGPNVKSKHNFWGTDKTVTTKTLR